MSQSTLKKQLLQQGSNIPTPVKKLVARQINSWMETNEKDKKVVQKNTHLNVPPKIRIKRKTIVGQNLINNNIIKHNDQNECQNLLSLKRRKDDLMRSLSNKKFVNQQTKTKENSIQGSNSSKYQRKPHDWFMKLPLVHVNQFVIDQKQNKQFHQVVLAPEVKPSKNCQAVTTRKSSLRRIDRKKNQKPEKHSYCKYLQAKARNLSVENKNMIQENILRNNYIGFLASISRRTCNILVSLKDTPNF